MTFLIFFWQPIAIAVAIFAGGSIFIKWRKEFLDAIEKDKREKED